MRLCCLFAILLILQLCALPASAGPKSCLGRASRALGAEKFGILVIDKPIDSQNPDIAKWRTSGAEDQVEAEYSTKTLGDQNDLHFQDRKDRLLKEAADHTLLIEKRLEELAKKFESTRSPAKRKELKLQWTEEMGKLKSEGMSPEGLVEVLHGTHVSAVAMAGAELDQVHLVHMEEPSEMLGQQAFEDPQYATRLSAKWKSALTSLIHLGNVKVVNLSFDISAMPSEPSLESGTAAQVSTVQPAMEIWQHAVSEIYKENPDVIFVIAAGNDGKDVDDHHSILGRTRHFPNVIRVASTDFSGKLSTFSNRSPDFVELAAPGENIPGLSVLGGKVELSGTSQAAPLVVNRIRKILEENGADLGAEQVLKILFEQGTVELPSLRGSVKGGRFLIPSSFRGHKMQHKDIDSLTRGDWIRAGDLTAP